MNGKRFLAAVFAAMVAAGAAAQVQPKVTANDLKADVSFLASDALEGRGTPSKGLDIAAEYIAAGVSPRGPGAGRRRRLLPDRGLQTRSAETRRAWN